MCRNLSENDAKMQVQLPYNMILVHNHPAKCHEMEENKNLKPNP